MYAVVFNNEVVYYHIDRDRLLCPKNGLKLKQSVL